MRKRLYMVVVCFLSFSFLLTGCKSKRENVVTIAAVAPLTGKYAEMGADLLAGVKMAVNEKNDKGGINGKKVVVIEADDKASPKDSVSVAQMLITNKEVVGVIGHMNSGTTLSAAPVYSQANMPLVMPVPTNPDITKQNFNNLIRIPITDDKQGGAIINFVLDKMKLDKVAIVHNKQAYGEGLAREAEKTLNARGYKPLIFLGVNADDQDFKSAILKVKSLEPNVVFFGGDYAEAALFIKQSRESGLNSPFVMGDGSFNSKLIEIAGKAAEGCVVTNIAPMTAPSDRAKEFYRNFEKKHNKIVAFAPLGYVSANILMDAIEKAPTKDKEGVLKVLKDPNYSYDSILGKFSFEANGDSKGDNVFLHEIKDGKFVTINR
ncbi:MAG: branched-chain amino acid ABC transporter substrate-binding protein [Nitrospirae bacterium]|nr:branched-chain amino acid ABC transporter substrate-binding protein [Nitrospirota bacterium]